MYTRIHRQVLCPPFLARARNRKGETGSQLPLDRERGLRAQLRRSSALGARAHMPIREGSRTRAARFIMESESLTRATDAAEDKVY